MSRRDMGSLHVDTNCFIPAGIVHKSEQDSKTKEAQSASTVEAGDFSPRNKVRAEGDPSLP